MYASLLAPGGVRLLGELCELCEPGEFCEPSELEADSCQH
jgi:hypothetical protein